MFGKNANENKGSDWEIYENSWILSSFYWKSDTISSFKRHFSSIKMSVSNKDFKNKETQNVHFGRNWRVPVDIKRSHRRQAWIFDNML